LARGKKDRSDCDISILKPTDGTEKYTRQQRSPEKTKKQPEPFAIALQKFVHQIGITKKMKQFSVITSVGGNCR